MRGETRLQVRVKPLNRSRLVKWAGSGLRKGFAKSLMISQAAAANVSLGWNYVLIEWPVFLRDHFFDSRMADGLDIRRYHTRAGRWGGNHRTPRPGFQSSPVRASALILLGSGLRFGAGVLTAQPLATIVALPMAHAFGGALIPLLLSWINQCIPAAKRATLLAFSGAFERGRGAAGLLAGGYLADHGGIPLGWRLSAISSLFAIPFLLAARPRLEA